MKPEDVPTELADIITDRLNDDAHENCDDENGCPGNVREYFEEVARTTLAELLPEHERQVRAKVAQEIARLQQAEADAARTKTTGGDPK